MGLAFPTHHGPPPGACARPRPGEPTRANPCRCIGGPVLSEPGGTCVRCGRYPRDTISETWHQRAQTVAAVGSRRKRLAA